MGKTLGKTPGRISRTLTVLLRAERLIAARRVSILRRQTVLMAFAGLFATVALVMANVASYQGLSTVMPTAWGALFVALGNLLLAGIFAVIAGRMSADRDLEGVTEMRDLALEELEDELDELVEEVRGTARDVRRLVRDPFGSVLPGLITPLLSALLSGRGGDASPPDPAPAPQPDSQPQQPAQQPVQPRAATTTMTEAPAPHPPEADPSAPFPVDPAAPQS